MRIISWLVVGSFLGCSGAAALPSTDASITDDGSVVDASTPNDGAAGDSADASAEGAADASTFDVRNVTGLALWLEASQKVTVVSGGVSEWQDLSANANHATQTDPTLRPALTPSVLNGHPIIHFSKGTTVGRLLTIADSPSLDWDTADYAIWIVARFDNMTNEGTAAYGVLFNKFDTTTIGAPLAPFLIANATINGQPAGGISTGLGTSQINYQHPYNDGTFRAFVSRRSGPTLELRVNGNVVAQDTKTTVADASSPGIPVRIGMEIAQYRRLDGDIAELIAARGALTTQDIVNVETYLRGKYSL